MRIGIDIDDTIANTNELIIKYALKYDLLYKDGRGFKDKNCYKFHELFYWDEDEKEKFFARYMQEILSRVPVKENVREIIKKLRQEGHEIIFITTRDYLDNCYDITVNWLNKNEIEFDMVIAGDKRKSDYAESLKFDLFIDDNIKNCTKVSGKNIDVLLFDTIYNRDCNDFKRVYNWLEIYDYINKKK